MKKLLMVLSVITVVTSFSSCRKKGCMDPTAVNYDAEAKKEDGTCEWEDVNDYQITFQFSHNYDGVSVSNADFDNLTFTNQAGTVHSITKLNYLVSDFRLYTSSGDSVMIDGYQFVSLSDASTFNYTIDQKIPVDTYTGVAFNFGFDSADNVSGAYADLNVLNWAWPAMLGGGYHNMQFEGKYISNVPDTASFAYHMGMAREITVTDTIFHANHFLTELSNSEFSLTNNATIEVKMNIAEWFKNPNNWDLNTYNAMLMPNFAAQIMMKENGPSVFSVGSITQ